MIKKIFVISLILTGAFATATRASAHAIPSDIFSMVLNNTQARILATPPVAVFAFADDDADGQLSLDELDAHREAINAQVLDQLILLTDDNVVAEPSFIDVLLHEPDSENDFVIVRMNYQWEIAPETVSVDYGLWSAGTNTDVNWIINDRAQWEQFEGVFTPESDVLQVGGAEAEHSSGALWLAGVRHVLEGFDHILFIMALVLAAVTLRRLLLPLTAFTLAHTVSLAAVAFGFDPLLPSWAIEATIAASIAILAGLYLLKQPIEKYWWVAAVMGLVHGLGFGQALTTSLGSLQDWGAALVAITIGVELTHLAIALVTLGGLKLLRSNMWRLRVQTVSGIAIACVSLMWTVQRIPF